MQVILNEQGYVHEYALIGSFGFGAVNVIEPEDINDFENNYYSYYLSDDGMLVKNVDKQREVEERVELDGLRFRRDRECFSYVNRGHLWYNRLTDEQKAELDTWYQAWLDVTDTMSIPEMPEWLM